MKSVTGTAIGDLHIRERRPEDDQATLDMMQRARPDMPQRTPEEFRADIASLPEGIHALFLVGESGGRIVGQAGGVSMFWTSDRTRFHLFLTVDPETRRRGVGGALYRTIMDDICRHDARRVYAMVREDEPESIDFARRRAFAETGHVEKRWRLDVREARTETGLGDRLAGEGVTVQRLVELDADEGLLRRLHEVDIETNRDAPQSEPFDLPFDQWCALVLERPGAGPESTFVALDGNRPIGLATLVRVGGIYAHHNGLGVLREYRGRGIARLIKQHQILWARQVGIRWLDTGNDAANPGVLAINRRLGYQPMPTSLEMAQDVRGTAGPGT